MGGDAYERDLVTRLRDLGWYAQRAGSSGSATKAALPDVLAAKAFPDGQRAAWAIELKTSDPDNLVYVENDEIEGLYDIAQRAGFTPKVALRWKQDTTFYLETPDASSYWTDAGHYRARSDDRDEWSGEILRKPEDGGLTNTDLPAADGRVEVDVDLESALLGEDSDEGVIR